MNRLDNNLNELSVMKDELSRSIPIQNEGNEDFTIPSKDEPSRSAPKKSRSSSAVKQRRGEELSIPSKDEPSRSAPRKSRSSKQRRRNDQSLTGTMAMKDEPSRSSPRKSKSSSVRLRRGEMKKQLQESALSHMQMGLEASEGADAATPPSGGISRSRSSGLPRIPKTSPTEQERQQVNKQRAQSAPFKPPSADEDDASRASLSSRVSRGRMRTSKSSKSSSNSSVASASIPVASSERSTSRGGRRKRSSSASSRARRKNSEVKGDSAPSVPRKAPPSPTEEDALQREIEKEIQDSRWESDKMQPPESGQTAATVVSTCTMRRPTRRISRRESDEIQPPGPGQTTSTVVSKSTILRRPTRKNSTTSRPGMQIRRSKRFLRSASESCLKAIKSANEEGTSAVETDSTMAQPPLSPTEPSLSTPDPHQEPHPAYDPSVVVKPTRERRRGSFNLPKITKSFNFSFVRKDASRSKQIEVKTTNTSNVLGSFFKRPDEHSMSQRTLSTMATENSDLAESFSSNPADFSRFQRTVSTMATEHSDLSIQSGSYESRLASPRRATADSNHVGHLLDRLRTAFDEPSPPRQNQAFEDSRRNETDVSTAQPMPMLDDQFSNMTVNAVQNDGYEDDTIVSESRTRNILKSDDEAPSKSVPRRSKSAGVRPLSSNKKRGRKRTALSTSPLKKREKKSVNFDSVVIREYERDLGDNPAVSSGPPIGLGWAYLPSVRVDIDFYEANVRKPAPRTRKDFFLTPQKRFHLLLDKWGFSVMDICRAKDQASEIRYQRQMSVFGCAMEPQLKAKKKGAASDKDKKEKLAKVPKAQDRWNASCPAAPVSV